MITLWGAVGGLLVLAFLAAWANLADVDYPKIFVALCSAIAFGLLCSACVLHGLMGIVVLILTVALGASILGGMDTQTC